MVYAITREIVIVMWDTHLRTVIIQDLAEAMILDLLLVLTVNKIEDYH